MKKHLIAAAVAAAVGVPAAAQVTISGRVDQSINFYNNGTNSNQIVDGGTFTSERLTIRAQEDLGGGLKAGIVLEHGIQVDQNETTTISTSSVSTTVGNTGLFSRESYGFVSGGFGTVAIGKVTHWSTDVDVYVNATGANPALAGTDTLGDKANNSIVFTSPSFSGIQVQVGRQQGETAGNNVSDVTSFTARYAQGPFKLTVSRASKEVAASTDLIQTGFGGSYDLGMATVSAYQILMDNSDSTATDEETTRGFQVAVPMGKMTLLGSYTDRENDRGAAYDGDGYMVGVKYDFSKRTALYAAHSRADNKASGNLSLGVNAAIAGKETKATSIGLVHFF